MPHSHSENQLLFCDTNHTLIQRTNASSATQATCSLREPTPLLRHKPLSLTEPTPLLRHKPHSHKNQLLFCDTNHTLTRTNSSSATQTTLSLREPTPLLRHKPLSLREPTTLLRHKPHSHKNQLLFCDTNHTLTRTNSSSATQTTLSLREPALITRVYRFLLNQPPFFQRTRSWRPHSSHQQHSISICSHCHCQTESSALMSRLKCPYVLQWPHIGGANARKIY